VNLDEFIATQRKTIADEGIKCVFASDGDRRSAWKCSQTAGRLGEVGIGGAGVGSAAGEARRLSAQLPVDAGHFKAVGRIGCDGIERVMTIG
jgi:hypothetical protein